MSDIGDFKYDEMAAYCRLIESEEEMDQDGQVEEEVEEMGEEMGKEEQNPSSADTILVTSEDILPPPPMDPYMLLMKMDNEETPSQTSSKWDNAIDEYLASLIRTQTPSPLVSEGSSLPEIVGIERFVDLDS